MSISTKLTAFQLEAAQDAVNADEIANYSKPLIGGLFSYSRREEDKQIFRTYDQKFEDRLHDNLAKFFRDCMADREQREETPLDSPETVYIIPVRRLLVEWPGNPNRYDLRCAERVARTLGFNFGVHLVGRRWFGFGDWAFDRALD